MILLPIAFAVIWGVLVVGSSVVGRDPKKYGKRIVRLFFKDGYVRY